MIAGTISGLVLGFFLATAYGAGFHLILGGRARHIVLYVLSSWIGFLLGHFLGDLLSVDILKLGPVHLFSASFGAWLAIVVSWLLAREDS